MLASGAAQALIPEPPFIIRGTVKVNGQPRTWGSVTVRLDEAGETVASFPLGTLPGSPNGYVLLVPMDALEPRAPNTARPGDMAYLYVDGAPLVSVPVDARGASHTTPPDLDVTIPHAIVLIRGPTATPSSTPSRGTVYLDIAGADTGGHALSYAWSAACPGPDEGVFDNFSSPSPVWTAPVAGGTPLSCTLTVAIADGQGLSVEPSVSVTVQATVAPEPVPQFVAGPDPTLCGEQMAFDAGASFHSNPDRTIVLYEWDFDYDGATFDAQAVGATTTHDFAGRAAPVTVALRVTDDGVPPRSMIATHGVHPGGLNRPPLANAGGPYGLSAGGSIVLNASASSDPDAPCGDAISSWAWDLDGDGGYDDAAGPQPAIGWATAETLLCGGRCVHGRSYPIGLRVADGRGASAEAVSAVVISLLIFADDFANGTARGDPDWLVKGGAWTVLGASAAKKYYASDPAKMDISVAKTLRLSALRTGMLETKVALTGSFVSYANGAMVFAYKDNTHYRYVRLQQAQNVWKLILGQIGKIGTDLAGAKKTKTLTGLKLGAWYRVWVDVYDTGRVNVWFKTRTGTPALTYKFKAAAAGKTGYQAGAARAYFDNFAAWDRGALP